MSSKKVTSGQRRQMIAEGAYFKAERRGFQCGDPARDWCEAATEAELAELAQRLDARAKH